MSMAQRTSCWIPLSERALLELREAVHEQAEVALRGASAAKALGSGKDGATKPIGLEQGCQLVLYYAQQLPELCRLCKAPREVCWSAVVFYRRFFAVRSPMAFDPTPVMFTAVFLACKVEEARQITLDKLLAAAEMSPASGMREKVIAMEVPFLEGLGFDVTIEPKVDSAFRALAEDLCGDLQLGGSPAAASSAAVAALLSDEERRAEVVRDAEDRLIQLAVRTDAVLRWPSSALLAVSFGVALGMALTPPSGSGAEILEVHWGTVGSLLEPKLELEGQRVALRAWMDEVRQCFRSPAFTTPVPEAVAKEAAKAARRCHRAFDRLRERAAVDEQSMAPRLEKKRKADRTQGQLTTEAASKRAAAEASASASAAEVGDRTEVPFAVGVAAP
mmetsp:Transcript_37649/g.95345  ORF Transcript_37649/g.95345 Transcript_37649/m.95345 type:complete len:390 (-) Transcript_37649:9-1178(-)